MSWASGLRAAIMTEEKVRDAASAQILKEEHKRFLAEIEAREESFRLVMELGEEMIQSQHYASEVCHLFIMSFISSRGIVVISLLNIVCIGDTRKIQSNVRRTKKIAHSLAA